MPAAQKPCLQLQGAGSAPLATEGGQCASCLLLRGGFVGSGFDFTGWGPSQGSNEITQWTMSTSRLLGGWEEGISSEDRKEEVRGKVLLKFTNIQKGKERKKTTEQQPGGLSFK